MQTTFYGLTFFYESEEEFPKGHKLLEEGAKQNHLYVLRRGAVEVLKQGQRIAICKERGELFGDMSALLGTENAATVRTLEPSVFYAISNPEEFLVEHPRTTIYVAKMLAKRLAQTTENLRIAKENAVNTLRQV